MNKTQEALTKAKELISNPENWIKRSLSQKMNGDHCYPTDKDAVKFCAIGAMVAAEKYNNIRLFGFKTIALVIFNNDENTTHEMMMNRFDELIAEAA